MVEGEVATWVMKLGVLDQMVRVEEVTQVVALTRVVMEVVAPKQVVMERQDYLVLMGEVEALQQVETGANSVAGSSWQ